MVFSIAHGGVYRSQCAEFCGLQHANMAIEIVALPPEAFETWRTAQLQPAAEPSDEQRRQGRDVFLSSACVMCHSIRGTSAAGRTAPDLTHLASRRTITAGTVLMNRSNLGAWITDPQRLKPGNHMPIVGMSATDFQNLLAYLDSLK
jgi:cytochrome c oxidase subunit 2